MNIERIFRTVLGTLVLGLFLNGVEVQGALLPVNLRCGQRINPLGIGDVAPRLSWQLQSDGQGRGETQSAYQIQVGSTAGAADLWDSGKVATSQTFDVLYAGQPLTSGKKCFWRVRVYDGSANVSAWSDPAQWSMGLLAPSDWTAQWIGYDAAYTQTPQQAADAALFNASGVNFISAPGQTRQGGLTQSSLRKRVVLPATSTITNAIVALSADNICSVFVNGQQTTNLAMRWEATAKINVTALLHSGTNVIALSATNTDDGQAASVLGRLVVQFSSGSVSNFPVDTSWKAAQWPSGNWTGTNYDDSAWRTPNSGGTPWGTPALHDLARVPAPYLRKSFAVGQSITRATAYVTALGAYELRLNGQRVGKDVLAPGWTQFSKRVYYQTYDVTGMVQYGPNVLSAILGDGWYASDLAFKGSRCNYGGTPRLQTQLVIELSDGSKQTIVSDGSWKASYGPIRYADLLLGSEYDARLEMPGWDTTNFNDSAWSPVVTGYSSDFRDVTALVTGFVSNNQLNFTASNGNLGGDPAYNTVKTLQITYKLGSTVQTQSFAENTTVTIGQTGQSLTIIKALYGNAASFNGIMVQAAVTEPARCFETLSATNLTVPKPGCYTFDLGQNMVGWVRLTVVGNAGDRITVRHGEMLNPDGSVYTANLRGANSTDFYTLATNGTSVFEPYFTFHGFRYVEVRGLTTVPTLNSVKGIVVHSDMPQTGQFSCSSPLVNQLFSNIIWGQKGNYLEVPTDCPQRDERMGWTGDTQFFVPTAAYDFDVQTFFRRHMVTLCEDSQHSDGSFAVVAPDLGQGSGGTAWGDAGWICPYNMYRVYGDTNIIADHYAAFQRCGDFDAAHASNFVISSLPGDFGDWVNLGGGATSKVMDTAYYAYYAQAMSEMAAAIGKSADAASYAALHQNIVAAFGNFFSADGSLSDGSSQTGYALAFSMDLVPPALRALAAQKFADSIAQFGNHLATGFIGTPRLLTALHAAGQDDLAYQLLLQETYPSWLFQVKLGATTMWERWDGWTPSGGFQTIGMNSFNHYAFGAVGEYLYSVVGGIKPASPAYKSILIQPVPGKGLTWANTSYNSTRGLISTAWTNVGGVFNLDTVIPPNTTAQIYVPTTNANAVTESGVAAISSPGVSYVGTSNNYAIYSVGSGHYVWSSPFALPPDPPSVVVTTTNQVGSGSGTFTPTWSVATNNSLIAGQAPSSTSGNYSMETSLGSRNINSLTSGGSLAITSGGNPNTTSSNYVTCGNNACTSVIYTLTGSTAGYDVTNITVYGGWGDSGRDQQAYTVYYSTAASPATYIRLTSVSFNPDIPSGKQSATRVTLTYPTGVLASNVASLKFDFSSPVSENGYCGYAAITVFGTPSAVVAAPTGLTAMGGNAQVTLVWNASSGAASYNVKRSTSSGGSYTTVANVTGTSCKDTGLANGITYFYVVSAANAGGEGPDSSPVSALTVGPVIVITTTNQTGTGSGSFTPSWTVVTNGSLIAGQSPSSTSGNFNLETSMGNRSVTSLTDGGSLTIATSTNPKTTSNNYVTCGNSAGSMVTYALTGASQGYDLTNIVVYGGWGDNGRDQQAYTIYYSTVSAPTNFIPLTSVNFNPSIADNLQSATRVTITSSNSVMAANVAAVKFDFSNPASENGYCGYAEITVFGVASGLPAVPTTLGVSLSPDQARFLMSVADLSPGRNYLLQSATNLINPEWFTETNFVPTQPGIVFTNAVSNAQKFYRIVGY